MRFLISILFLLPLPSLAAAEFQKKPYLQNLSQNGVTLIWQTENARPGTITLSPPTPPDRTVEAPASTLHKVAIADLLPDTRYRYKVKTGSDEATGEFHTVPDKEGPFFFVVFGDTRSNAEDHRLVVGPIIQDKPDFVIGTGDFVDEGDSEPEWQEFFGIEWLLMKDVCLFPVLGNHDRGPWYREYFATPQNGPGPYSYTFNYSNARFIVLDSNETSFDNTPQTAWLEKELAAAKADAKVKHVFVAMHHPTFSVANHGGYAAMRAAWSPLFEKYQVRAVFAGHDHVYSRAEQNGVTYFVSGGGGAPLYGRKQAAHALDEGATRAFERVNHYLRLRVWPAMVEVSAVRADGSLIESLTLGGSQSAGAPPPAPPVAGAPTKRRMAKPSRPWIWWAVGAVAVVGVFFMLRWRQARSDKA